MKKRCVLRVNALVFVQKGVLYDVNWGVKACILRSNMHALAGQSTYCLEYGTITMRPDRVNVRELSIL